MRDGENIRQVAELGVDWIGMIFWDKSLRNVTMIPTHAGIIPDRSSLSPLTTHHTPQRVGVFVDEMAQNIITRVVNFKLDLVQFHGHETPTLIRNLRQTIDPDIRPGIKFIKAISVSSRDDIAAYKDYEDCVDYFLFDTQKAPKEAGDRLQQGGTGQQFDWSLLDAYDGDKPFLLAGGIGPDDVESIRNFQHPKCIGIDLNSRFETEPGLKDIEKLKVFLMELT
jgi:phosphoribosylanthranilate isomerase